MVYLTITLIVMIVFLILFIIKKYSWLQYVGKLINFENNNIGNVFLNKEKNYPWVVNKMENEEMTIYNPPKKVELTDNIKYQISNIVKMTPSMKAIVQKENKLILKFKDEIAEKLKTGELKQVKVKNGTGNRAIAANQKGRFVGHGKWEIKEIKKVNPAHLANAALGVMSAITAQEYLERINQQLDKIDRKIDTLLRLIRNDKYGINKGNIEYLKLIYTDLVNASEESILIYRGQVQQIIRETYQQIESTLIEIPAILKTLSSIDVNTLFKMDINEDKITESVKNFENFLSLALGNLEVLAISIKLNNELSEDTNQMNIANLSKINVIFNNIKNYENQFTNIVNSKVDNFNAKFRTEKAVSKRQDNLRSILAKLKEELQVCYENVDDIILDKGVNYRSQFDLQIEYDESGEIINIHRLDKIETMQL